MKIKVISGIKADKLKRQIKLQGYTQESFAAKIGRTRMGLIRVLHTGTMKYPAFQKMVRALGLDESDLLE